MGTLLLDPYAVTIVAGSGGTISGGTFTPTANSNLGADTLTGALASANVTVSTGTTGAGTGSITLKQRREPDLDQHLDADARCFQKRRGDHRPQRCHHRHQWRVDRESRHQRRGDRYGVAEREDVHPHVGQLVPEQRDLADVLGDQFRSYRRNVPARDRRNRKQHIDALSDQRMSTGCRGWLRCRPAITRWPTTSTPAAPRAGTAAAGFRRSEKPRRAIFTSPARSTARATPSAISISSAPPRIMSACSVTRWQARSRT